MQHVLGLIKRISLSWYCFFTWTATLWLYIDASHEMIPKRYLKLDHIQWSTYQAHFNSNGCKFRVEHSCRVALKTHIFSLSSSNKSVFFLLNFWLKWFQSAYFKPDFIQLSTYQAQFNINGCKFYVEHSCRVSLKTHVFSLSWSKMRCISSW
jgi:hypothetical protein